MVEFAASVAVAEFPEHAADVPELVIYPAPLVIALLFSDMFAVPSNDTPAIVLAFAFDDWNGELPVPRTLDALRQDKVFLELSADAVVAAVTPAPSFETAA